MTAIDYGKHGFKDLEKLYEEKPYQGQHPGIAKVIFLGRDANYPKLIGETDFFKYILEYHKDGVAFWKKHNIHHPFLHGEHPYNKQKDKRFKPGVRYHKVFAKMSLDSRYADHISFVEILNKATCGNTGEDTDNWFYDNINDDHVKMLEDVLSGPGAKAVFIPKTVIGVDLVKVRRKTNRFAWLLEADRISIKDEPDCILKRGEVRFYKCSHFSSAISNHHLAKIGQIVREIIGGL